ncbi:4Fe-4S binding protein [Thauera aminoaromatica]|uniref:4Fe-4S dicluster domain-containing protein n=1 Tax=Thauera aminoaromatica TaxID=164330 RepID=A0A5C7T711_THASP|nr:4Fe-4S binding protein [Thauera aminoaromatica]TXH91517.1 MAG: 4Fe-4S dicluster domain-containing protein [Thauera aminoaromatica]
MSERRDPTSRIHLCDCNRSFALDAGRLAAGTDVAMQCHHALCGVELPALQTSLAGGKTVHVACTQETALFGELAEEAGAGERIRFFNLREHAGWSAESAAATPKLAALIAAATTLADPEPVAAVQMSAGRSLLIIGEAGAALGWAERLAGSFEPAVLITARSKDVELPAVNAYPVWSGRPVRLGGHLGAFQLEWTQHNPIDLELCVRCNACVKACPEGAIGWDLQVDVDACRSHGACVAACGEIGAIDFARQDSARSERFDLVLDLSAEPLLRRVELPDGYAAPGRDPFEQALAVQALGEFVGEFEKPRYVAFEAALCAHSRAKKTGCSNCIESCSTAAIRSNGDVIAVDPYLCKGCGTCSTVCPSGALSFQYPRVPELGQRVKTLLAEYARAGGTDACLLFHSAAAGSAAIARLARRGRGLPARVIPVEVWSADAVGLDLMLGSLALGACQVAVLAAGSHDAAPLEAQAGHGQAILSALGYGGEHLRVIEADADDWQALERALYDWAPAMTVAEPARFRLLAKKRETLDFALRHLVAHAPATTTPAGLPAAIALNAGAPFGQVIASDACTLCMSCTGACPAGALRAASDAYRLEFVEKNCLQCGLCEASCPESAITLEPRLLPGEYGTEGARRARALREADIFHCTACGKAMGAAPLIESMIARLSGHAMFAGEAERARLRMCADCRVIDMMKAETAVKAWDLTE